MSTPPTKSFWDTAGARIGIISGVVGLLVALLGLPGKVVDALRTLGVAEDPELAAEIEQSRPVLEVRYVLLTDDLLGWRQSLGFSEPTPGADSAQAVQSERARTLLSLPIVLTEASDDSELLEPATDEYLQPQTAFLLVENRGKRDASGVTLHARQLSFVTPPHVREGAAGEDYVATLQAGPSSSAPVAIGIPQVLAPGDAVLVPIFISGSPSGRHNEWWVLSKSALLPDSLTFTDPLIQRPRSAPVRRMVNPTLVERGILDRG